MTYTFIKKIFLILIFILIYFFDASAQEDYNFEKMRQGEMHFSESVVGNNSISSIVENYNIVYANCRWTIDPAVNIISGDIGFYFIPAENNFDTLSLDLADHLQVDFIIYDNLSIPFSHNGNVLNIYLPVMVSQGMMDSIRVHYHGAPVATGNGSFVQATHSGTPIIYTLSEPFGARDWWPCKQDLNDKIDSIDIIVTSPIAYRTASNGLLLSEDSTSTERICHWKSNYPIAAYLVALGVTDYHVLTEEMVLSNGDTLPIVNYVYPEVAPPGTQLHDIINVIHLYDSLTIPYPFSKEKYGHADFGWSGGMEHQTMSFIGNYNPELLAHECAHQWFGDMVTCSSWKDIWLHEGFATYFSGLVVEHFKPTEWHSWLSGSLGAAVSLPDGSVFCDDTTSVGRIFDGRLSYRKASSLLHMIRWKIGDVAFFNALKSYLTDVNVSYGYASTDDLKYHFEQESGQNLNQFFNEWYYGSGYPSYRLEWENNTEGINISIFQSSSDQSVSFFHVPVPIELKGGTHDTIVIVDPQFSGEVFSFDPGFKVEQIIFDPDLWIISKNVVFETFSELQDQIDISPNPVKNIFTISSRKAELFAKSTTIFDSNGKKVFSINYSDNISKRKVNVFGFASGIYFVKIETGSGVITKKVVVE